MRSPLPLNALRVFEAAARLQSFRRAADELGVTPAAVSQQIKALEGHLAVPLFRRFPRALRLTAEGYELHREISAAFDRLATAVGRIDGGPAREGLNISVVTTFALSWLVPRLGRWIRAHPELQVNIVATVQLTDFAREDVDLAVRYGRGPWPGLHQAKLFDDVLTPLTGREWRRHLSRPEDLSSVPLLAVSGHRHWQTWMRGMGMADHRITIQQSFDSSRIAIDAAIAGAGVALGNPLLHADLLRDKDLVQPFAHLVPSGESYWLVCPEVTRDQRRVAIFRNWLLDEIAVFNAAGTER